MNRCSRCGVTWEGHHICADKAEAVREGLTGVANRHGRTPVGCAWCEAEQPGPRAARAAGWLQPHGHHIVRGGSAAHWGNPGGSSFLCPECQQEAQAAALVSRMESRIEQVEAERDRLREALTAIKGPWDSDPWFTAYMKAGGGYEGLQAIAREALDA